LTNYSQTTLINPIKFSSIPFQKSIVSCQPHYKTTTHQGIIPSSMYMSTMSPVKSTNQDFRGDTPFETVSNMYPAVQTQTSCSKGEILIQTFATTAQKKGLKTFSNSIVTKFTATKPNSQKPSAAKQSHGKSSDYYATSSWKNQSLATAATAAKAGSSSLLATPNLTSPINRIAFSA